MGIVHDMMARALGFPEPTVYDKPKVIVTEARVEFYHVGTWQRRDRNNPGEPIPEAVEHGRGLRAAYLRNGITCPVRVVDSSGVVVAQWGTP